MNYIFDNERPIYIQIVDNIKTEIVSGNLKKGEKLPSVRELALIMKVNPNTVQKALSELEDEKLIYTERTNGKFVTDDEKLISDMKTEMARQKVKTYLDSMYNIGIDFDEAAQYLQKLGGK